MSMTAQSRDLNDRKTILDFAAVVQSLERMKMLLILTVADIQAVGPGVWNGWKGQLLRTLYYETEPVLTGGHSQVSRDRRVAAAQEELAEALADWPEDERDAYLEPPLPGLLAPGRPAAEGRPCRVHPRGRPRASGRSPTAIRTRDFEAVTEITVFAPDHPRLLSIIAGACTIAGANIVDAQIYTTTDGQALDTISICARVRRRCRRGAPGAEGRRPDRAGARRLAPPARAGRAADQEEAAPQGLHASRPRSASTMRCRTSSP